MVTPLRSGPILKSGQTAVVDIAVMPPRHAAPDLLRVGIKPIAIHLR